MRRSGVSYPVYGADRGENTRDIEGPPIVVENTTAGRSENGETSQTSVSRGNIADSNGFNQGPPAVERATSMRRREDSARSSKPKSSQGPPAVERATNMW